MSNTEIMEHPAEFKDDDFILIRDFISRETGIRFRHDRKQHLQMVLDERLRAGNHKSYRDYYCFIQSHPRRETEVRRLIEHVTVGETSFFRNRPHFELLTNTILPEIMGRRKENDKAIRIWSAGCSRGNEPYSIAIALREASSLMRGWDTSIFATDINHHALARAREGVYSSRDLSRVPPEYISKYFHQNDHQYRLADEVKRCVKFGYHNLATDSFHIPELENLDVIFCRNVTIYFDLQTTKRIVEQFYDCLRAGGYLFIGHAETLWQITDKYELMEFPRAYAYKKTAERPKTKETVPFAGVSEIPLAAFRLKQPVLRPSGEKGRIGEDIVPQVPAVRSQVKEGLAQATLLANHAQYKEAIRQLERVLGEDSLCREAYYLLGILHHNAGSYDQAITQFKKVMYIDPEAVLAYFNLGNIYLHQKKFRKARKEFENALGILKKRDPQEKVEFSDDFTVDYLLRACENNLAKIRKSLI